ncbi:GntR family transcriptional regulator [Microbacterium sp. SA39]|uniref:GntR family transcriptional regulator n=1 Tax=Microbacterium sp. SA39 TaxID=1263625 RepID=UPI0005FA23A7|nr:GntR family transcriptional regulator [Microbacterium sp. SA39]KJQ55800.1 putative HTH-type transcriptional regulator YdfH [Microbacterium sp. SA39]
MGRDGDVKSGEPKAWGPSQVSSVSRKAAVGIEVRRAIVLGRLRPGDRLTEAGLALSLGVSRPTVREALNQLSREGLVVAEPYRGLRVAEVSLEQIQQIAVTRHALDMVAVEAILADGSGAKLALVERGWQRFESRASDPDPVVQHDAHVDFHHEIWEASGNYLLARLWPVTEAQITIALAEDQWMRSDPIRAHRVHEQLMEALRTRDIVRIERAFRAHTIDSANELVALLADDGEER